MFSPSHKNLTKNLLFDIISFRTPQKEAKHLEADVCLCSARSLTGKFARSGSPGL